MVPLGELCSMLGFGIQVVAEKGRAEGFFVSPKRRFLLDLNAGVAEVEGRRLPLGSLLAVREGQEIFVDARLLALWFPLKVVVNTKAAVLRLTSTEKLPVEAEWEREGKAGYLAQNPGGASDSPVGTFKDFPYSFLDMPFADVSTSWSKSQHGASGPPSISTNLAGDFLWMSANFYAARDNNGQIKNTSLSLFREDPNAALLGPLHATHVELGNLMRSASLEIAGDLPRGRGLLVDNYPMNYRSKFASRTFQGYLQEGWSVELYQNKALLGYQRSRPDGRYEFPDTPLRFGLNQFKLVFHGPFGQIREESYRVEISSDQPPPGAFYYRLAGSRPSSVDQTSGGQPGATLPESRINSMAEMEYGLTPYLAANAAVSKIADSNDVLHTYDVVGLRSLFSYLSLQGNAAQDVVQGRASGVAAQGILRTGYEYSSLTLERSEYRRGFEQIGYQVYGATPQHLRSVTMLQWDGSWTMRKTPINLAFSRRDLRYAEGGGSTTDTLRSTLTFPAFVVAPSLSRTVNLGWNGTTNLNGNVYVSFRKGEYDLQGQMNATHSQGKTELSGWSAEANRTLPSGLAFRLGIGGRDLKPQNVEIKGNLSKQTGAFAYGVDLQFAKASGYSLGFRIQASFGREPRTGKWAMDGRSMAGQGAVSLVAFKDNNGNKVLDPGEPVLPETQFKVGTAAIENAIQDSKVVFRPQLSRGQDTLIRVNESSLEDSSFQSTVKAYRILPRSGKVMRLDFPITVFGEINGTTRIRRTQKPEEFGGLELELLRANGQRVKLFRSAYDGFFELRDLPIGDYVLRVSSQEIERLKIQEPPARKFHITNEKSLFEGQDFIVEAPQPAPDPTPAAMPTPTVSADPASAPSAPKIVLNPVPASATDSRPRTTPMPSPTPDSPAPGGKP